MEKGFEVVGLEPNPLSFRRLQNKCNTYKSTTTTGNTTATCKAITDLSDLTLPLQRESGVSYLIRAASGETQDSMTFHAKGPLGTFADMPGTKPGEGVNVTVLPIDEVIAEDVFLLMIDVQGFEYHTLMGAKKLFENHIVRMLIFELDSKLSSSLGVAFMDVMNFVYSTLGMFCFTASTDQSISSYGMHSDQVETLYAENVEKCWSPDCVLKRLPREGPVWWGKFDDYLCLNRRKAWPGIVPDVSVG